MPATSFWKTAKSLLMHFEDLSPEERARASARLANRAALKALLPRPGPAAAPVNADDKDLSILRALESAAGLWLNLYQIATRTQRPRVSRNTVQKRMGALLAAGLVALRGKRGGHAVTAAGKALLRDHPAPGR